MKNAFAVFRHLPFCRSSALANFTERKWRARLFVCGLLAMMTVSCTAQTGPAPISGDVPEAAGWRAEVVVGGLDHPWSIAWLPDGSALVTERAGRLRLIRDGKLDPEPIAGLPPVLAFGQGGLLDVALHPDFADNHLVYLSFATGTPEANRTALARGRFDGQDRKSTRLNSSHYYESRMPSSA